MPKELNLTPPLVEAQKMIADFLTAQVINDSDLKRLSQLIEVGQQEIERGKDNDRVLAKKRTFTTKVDTKH